MPDAEYHEKRREKLLEEKKNFERKWGWLAHLIAAAITTFFRILQSILRIIFAILSGLAQGL